MLEGFHRLVEAEEEIHGKLDRNYDKVMESSRRNIKYASEVLDAVLRK